MDGGRAPRAYRATSPGRTPGGASASARPPCAGSSVTPGRCSLLLRRVLRLRRPGARRVGHRLLRRPPMHVRLAGRSPRPPSSAHHRSPTSTPARSTALSPASTWRPTWTTQPSPTATVTTAGYQLAELIFDTLRIATRHANAPDGGPHHGPPPPPGTEPRAAVEAPVPGLQAAMDAAPAPGTHTTPPGSPAARPRPAAHAPAPTPG